MIFTAEQIQELTGIVDYHSSFLIASIMGKEVLTEYDKFILNQNGIDIDKIQFENPSFYQMYLFGTLSAQLSNQQTGSLEYSDFIEYVKRGQYIPLSKQELQRYKIAQNKTYQHLKGFNQRQKTDILTIVSNEMSKGVNDRSTLKSIISEIGHKTEIWDRDWGRIVETEYNNIFQKGRAEFLKETKGTETKVFKEVFAGACRHCIGAYLTNGAGSQPKIFTLTELEANGSNVGRKVIDWLPVLDSMHPWCRCILKELPKGYVWSEEKEKFSLPDTYETKREAKVKVTVGDKEYLV